MKQKFEKDCELSTRRSKLYDAFEKLLLDKIYILPKKIDMLYLRRLEVSAEMPFVEKCLNKVRILQPTTPIVFAMIVKSDYVMLICGELDSAGFFSGNNMPFLIHSGYSIIELGFVSFKKDTLMQTHSVTNKPNF